MLHVSEKTDLPLPMSCLRLLVPPLQLVSAAIWGIVQQKVVANYGLLDDFVTAVTKIVPELLSHRQRCLLSLGLRVQLTLELCRPEHTIDVETLQPHLDIITSIWNTEMSVSGDGWSGPNFLGLIQTLLQDQEERQHFFQDVFPVRFGDKYSEDIQMFVEIFLLQLEKLLTVPNYKQVARMLSDVPSVLSECVKSFCQSQELKSLLEYQKDLSQLNENDDQTVGAGICSALCLPPLTKEGETPPEVKVFTDYVDAFDKELTVETKDAKTESDEAKRRETESRGLQSRSYINSGDGVKDEISYSVQHVESLDGDETSVNCAVEVQVGYNVEICVEDSREKNPSVEDSVIDVRETQRPVRQNQSLEVKNISTTPKNQQSKSRPRVLLTGRTCPTCGKTYSRASAMKQHQITHTGERPFQCSRCKKCFQSQSDLKRHESNVCWIQIENRSSEVHKGKDTRDPEPGGVCDQLPTLASDVRTYEKECLVNDKDVEAPSGEGPQQDLQPSSSKVQFGGMKEQSQEPYQGNQGGKKPKSKNLGQEPCSCTKCGLSFKGFVDLKQHYVDAHDFRGPFPCSSCERTYKYLKALIRHERFHSDDLPFKCSKCPKAFGCASNLTLHARTHTNESLFLCRDCGKGCKSNAALRIHRFCCHSSAEEKHFCCEHCGRAYALKRSLDLHVAKLHTGMRHPCSHCGKQFWSANSLKRHDLTHTEERPYSCVKCAKSFPSASELKLHTRYHTGERLFTCPECGKGFVKPCYLTAHMRMHTGEKPYRCATCDRCFKSTGSWKRHQTTHTGEKPHKCSSCEMAFSRADFLKAHVRKRH